jgi:hypothetical protein
MAGFDPAIGPPAVYYACWMLMAGSSPAMTIESDESPSMRLGIGFGNRSRRKPEQEVRI